MRTTLFAFAALLCAGTAPADETVPPAENEAPGAAGVWYGMYRNYVNRFSLPPGSTQPRTTPMRWEATTIEPVFVVMTLEPGDEAITGTITAGRGIRYEDPQAAMKRLLDIPLDEARPPPTRALEGTADGNQLTLTVLPPLGVAEPIVDITAELDGDRLRARLQVAADDVRIVRFERCDPHAAPDASAEAAEANEAFCSAEAIWRRLSQQHGLAVDPTRPSRRR